MPDVYSASMCAAPHDLHVSGFLATLTGHDSDLEATLAARGDAAARTVPATAVGLAVLRARQTRATAPCAGMRGIGR